MKRLLSVFSFFIICQLIGCSSASIECPQTDYDFNAENKYLEYLGTLPRIKHMTICFLFQPKKGLMEGVLVSYGTESQPHMFAMIGVTKGMKPSVSLFVNGQRQLIIKTTPGVLRDEKSLCAVLDTTSKKVQMYNNGYARRRLHYENMEPLPRGGKILFGKSLDPSQKTLSSRIRIAMIWGRKLDSEEILNIYKHKICPDDPLVVLLPENVIPHGIFMPQQTCPNVTFIFDNRGESLQYLVGGSFPEVRYGTLCTWVTSDKTGKVPGTVGSYIIKNGSVVFSVGGFSRKKGRSMHIPMLSLIINGQERVIKGQLPPNTKNYLCLELRLPENKVNTYVNGMYGTTIYFENVGNIRSGGVTIIGQRQECLGGCFSREQAFHGTMRNPILWARILSREEIKATYESNLCPVDADLDFELDNAVPHGRFLPYQECPRAEYTLNQKKQGQYIEVKGSLPPLRMATVCNWLTTNAEGIILGTAGSYATTNQMDVLLAGSSTMKNVPVLNITVNGEFKIKSVRKLEAKTEYFICQAYNFPTGQVYNYLNGFLAINLQFQGVESISGGGKYILGQRQGCLGGCFERDRAYSGKIRNFMIWERILSSEEINGIFKANECPTGHIVDLMPENVIFHQRIRYI